MTEKLKLENIAYQKNLDGNDKFKEMLETYEPKWNGLYQKLMSSSCLGDDYKEILTYLLLLKLNNPKQNKQRLKILLQNATENEKIHLQSLEDIYLHKQIRDILICLGVLDIDRAQFLNFPYRLVKNATVIAFATSDNPWITFNGYQFIAISKDYALQICSDSNNISNSGNQDLLLLSSEADIGEMNCCMRENAGQFVYASQQDIF